jgi:hypothetical protein
MTNFNNNTAIVPQLCLFWAIFNYFCVFQR